MWKHGIARTINEQRYKATDFERISLTVRHVIDSRRRVNRQDWIIGNQQWSLHIFFKLSKIFCYILSSFRFILAFCLFLSSSLDNFYMNYYLYICHDLAFEDSYYLNCLFYSFSRASLSWRCLCLSYHFKHLSATDWLAFFRSPFYFIKCLHRSSSSLLILWFSWFSKRCCSLIFSSFSWAICNSPLALVLICLYLSNSLVNWLTWRVS